MPSKLERVKIQASLLPKLYALLQRLPTERRRRVLAKRLSEPQRLMLERWILAQRTAPRQSQIYEVARGRKKRPGHQAGSSHQAEDKRRRMSEAGVSRRQPSSRVAGVIRNPQRNGIYYSAQVAVGCMRVISRSDRDMQLILRFHEVLEAIRNRVLDAGGTMLTGEQQNQGCSENSGAAAGDARSSFEDVFHSAIQESLEEHGLDAAAVGLRFFVSLKPLWAARPLCTRTYTLAELDSGLRAWRRLTEAHGNVRQRSHVLWTSSPEQLTSAWQHFRKAYVDVMVEGGCCHKSVLARIQVLEGQRLARQEQQLEAWNRAHMAREESLQRSADRRAGRCVPCSTPSDISTVQVSCAPRLATGAAVERAIWRLLRHWAKEPSCNHEMS